MKKSMPWIMLTVVLAALFHGFGIWYLPSYLTEKTVAGIYQRRGTWRVNELGYGGLRSAGHDTVVRDNPDTVTSFAVFDVSEKPVKVHCVIPENDNYWSLSLFAWNTDNFFVVNDRTAESKEFDLVIAKRMNRYQKQDSEQVVVSPTDKGVLIIRMIVTNREDDAEIAKLAIEQKRTMMQSIQTSRY